jgi:hypothetical protein
MANLDFGTLWMLLLADLETYCTTDILCCISNIRKPYVALVVAVLYLVYFLVHLRSSFDSMMLLRYVESMWSD